MSKHVLRNSFHQKGLREQSHPLLDTAKQQPRSKGFPCHTNYPQREFWKDLSNIKVNNHRGKWGGLSLSFRSPLRLNNSHMNEIMTVLVSAVWLLLAWNWYKYYQDRFTSDDGVMMQTSEDNSAEAELQKAPSLHPLATCNNRKKKKATQNKVTNSHK